MQCKRKVSVTSSFSVDLKSCKVRQVKYIRILRTRKTEFISWNNKKLRWIGHTRSCRKAPNFISQMTLTISWINPKMHVMKLSRCAKVLSRPKHSFIIVISNSPNSNKKLSRKDRHLMIFKRLRGNLKAILSW